VDAVAARVVCMLGDQHQQPQQRWMDVNEAAEHLACKRQRLYNLVGARKVPFEKEGGRLLFDRVQLDAWVRKGGAR
jgi:excisionase family DNA binding protein